MSVYNSIKAKGAFADLHVTKGGEMP